MPPSSPNQSDSDSPRSHGSPAPPDPPATPPKSPPSQESDDTDDSWAFEGDEYVCDDPVGHPIHKFDIGSEAFETPTRRDRNLEGLRDTDGTFPVVSGKRNRKKPIRFGVDRENC